MDSKARKSCTGGSAITAQPADRIPSSGRQPAGARGRRRQGSAGGLACPGGRRTDLIRTARRGAAAARPGRVSLQVIWRPRRSTKPPGSSATTPTGSARCSTRSPGSPGSPALLGRSPMGHLTDGGCASAVTGSALASRNVSNVVQVTLRWGGWGSNPRGQRAWGQNAGYRRQPIQTRSYTRTSPADSSNRELDESGVTQFGHSLPRVLVAYGHAEQPVVPVLADACHSPHQNIEGIMRQPAPWRCRASMWSGISTPPLCRDRGLRGTRPGGVRLFPAGS